MRGSQGHFGVMGLAEEGRRVYVLEHTFLHEQGNREATAPSVKRRSQQLTSTAQQRGLTYCSLCACLLFSLPCIRSPESWTTMTCPPTTAPTAPFSGSRRPRGSGWTGCPYSHIRGGGREETGRWGVMKAGRMRQTLIQLWVRRHGALECTVAS